MISNRQNDASASPPGPPEAGPAAGGLGLRRHRLVLGVFATAFEAGGAIALLSRNGTNVCDVLLAPDAAMQGTARPLAVGAHVTIHYVDLSDCPALARVLARSLPLEPCSKTDCGAPTRAAGLDGLCRRIVRHLANGATVVIVHAPDPERQLVASRALLDAKCEVLLTHEILHADSAGPASCNEDVALNYRLADLPRR